jgi:hypothetical protein
MKDLNARSRGLKYMWRYAYKDGGKDNEMLGEVEGVTRDLVHWRHTVDLQERKCTCRHWQVTGLPCTHVKRPDFCDGKSTEPKCNKTVVDHITQNF